MKAVPVFRFRESILKDYLPNYSPGSKAHIFHSTLLIAVRKEYSTSLALILEPSPILSGAKAGFLAHSKNGLAVFWKESLFWV